MSSLPGSASCVQMVSSGEGMGSEREDLALLRSPPPFQGLCPQVTLVLDSAHGVLIGPAPGHSPSTEMLLRSS